MKGLSDPPIARILERNLNVSYMTEYFVATEQYKNNVINRNSLTVPTYGPKIRRTVFCSEYKFMIVQTKSPLHSYKLSNY